MRHWKLDFSRGIAVILMAIFNWSFSLYYLGIHTVTDSLLFWEAFPRLIGGSFILIAGISLWLGYLRSNNNEKQILRGAKIFAIGLGITAVTWLAFPQDFIAFGILHLIGLSIIIGFFAIRLKTRVLIAAGALLVLAGIALQQMVFSFPHLFWAGFIPEGFQTLDYFPLMPWLGVFLLGISLGKIFYPRKTKPANGPRAVFPVVFLGRHSLAVYLLHQPLLLAILLALQLL